MGDATILYATGTGNSWHAADVIAKRLSESGWTVEMRELRVGAELPMGGFSGDLLVLTCPTLGMAMPVGLRGLTRGLRAARHGTPAAVFATWGGDPGATLRQGRGLLRRRGFRVIAAGGASYPFNWTQFINPPESTNRWGSPSMGDADAERFAEGLLVALDRRGSVGGEGAAAATASNAAAAASNAATSLPATVRLSVSSALWLPLAWLYQWTGAPGLGAMYAADERCTACGICVRDCPSGAIHLRGNGKRRRPKWSMRCWGCNRCINICPEAAIQTSPLRTVVHLSLNAAIIVGVVIGCNDLARLAAQPVWITVPAWIALFALLLVLLTRLQFWLLEPLFFLLEDIPALRRAVGRSWTARFRRYISTGFTPAAARRAAHAYVTENRRPTPTR